MSARRLPVSACWNTIGVKGDRSCQRLAEVRHCHHCPTFEQAAEQFLNRAAPDSYADEIAALLAAPTASRAPADEASVVMFEIASQTLAIDTKAVVEITEPRPVRRIPHRTNRVLLGLVNVRGQLELCASLSGLLHITSAQSLQPSRARMLLIEWLGQRWVVSADNVLGVQRLGSGGASPVPATAERDGSFCITQLIAWNDRKVGVLDLDKTFAALRGSLS